MASRWQLAERFQSDDRTVLQGDAHKVAGSAGVLGFLALGEAARGLEAACRDGLPFAIALAATQALSREAVAALEAWTERLSGLVDA